MTSEIVQADCRTARSRWGTEWTDLVFADPPFNIGYEYDTHADDMSKDDYLDLCWQCLFRCTQVLKPRGTLWLAIGDDYAAELRLMLDDLGLHRRSWVIWHYTFGVHCEKKFGRDHTHLFYYTKHPTKFTFNADAIRVESERQRIGDKRANPKGRVPGDVWTFSRLCGTFRERTGHPCQMPEELIRRIVLATSNPGDAVFEPFGGSFVTCAVAKKTGRFYRGMDISPDYVSRGRERLEKIEQGLLGAV